MNFLYIAYLSIYCVKKSAKILACGENDKYEVCFRLLPLANNFWLSLTLGSMGI